MTTATAESQADQDTEQFLIYSNHHHCWWGPNGSGYRSNATLAGRYDLADTDKWLTRGCGCCVVPEVVVPVPTTDVLNDPVKLAKFERFEPRKATMRAKRAGQINTWAERSR